MVLAIKLKFLAPLIFAKKYQAVVVEESKRAINKSTLQLRETMVLASPFGGTSLLKQSWITRPARVLTGRKVRGRVVAKGSVAANVIDKGARPHFPPVGAPGTTPALGIWILRKLGITDDRQIRKTAFAISRKFRRRGIPAKRTFTIAFRASTGEIVSNMNEMAVRIKQRL